MTLVDETIDSCFLDRAPDRLIGDRANYRRLITRHERHAENFLGFVRLGCISILMWHF